MAAHEPVCGRANIMDVIDKGEIYLTFVFDGIDSSQIGVASVSDGSTYDTPILPEFSDNSLEVDGYDGKYYFNTRLSQKSFTYNCFIDNLLCIKSCCNVWDYKAYYYLLWVKV